MAHAAAHIKKARSEMDQPPDLKALEKARERRRRSRERAERKRKVPARPIYPSRSPVNSIPSTSLSSSGVISPCCPGENCVFTRTAEVPQTCCCH